MPPVQCSLFLSPSDNERTLQTRSALSSSASTPSVALDAPCIREVCSAVSVAHPTNVHKCETQRYENEMTDFTCHDLTAEGTSTLDGMLTCRSDSFFTGFLRVGALAAVGFNVLEIAEVNQSLAVGTTLSVAGDSTLEGKLTVTGGEGLEIAGPVVISDVLRTNTPHGIVCGGELQVAQDAVLQETLSVAGLATFTRGAAVTSGNLAITALSGARTEAPTLTTSISGVTIFVNPGGSGSLSGSIVFRGTGSTAVVNPGDTVTLTFGQGFNSTMRLFLQTGNNGNPAQTWGGCHWDVTTLGQSTVTMMARGAASDDFGGDGFLYLYYFALTIGFV